MQNHDPLLQIDMNLMVTLRYVLSERSVSRAARNLGLTQSAMSHRLRRLRTLFDDPLLVSGGREMVLTERASQLLPRLERALGEFQTMVAAREQFDPAHSTRTFVISAADYVSFAILPKIIEDFCREAPNIELIFEAPRPDMGQALQQGHVDLVFSPVIDRAGGLRRRRTDSESFVVLARKGHPELGDGLSKALFLRLPHLLIAPRGAKGGIVDDHLQQQGLQRKVYLRIAHFAPGPFIVAESDLLLTVPQRLADTALQYAELDVFPHPFEIPQADSYMIWHERVDDDPGHQWLRDKVIHILENFDS